MRLDASSRPLRILLERSRAMSCKEAAPTHVACASGVVWLTVEGQPGDTFLRAGDQATIPAGHHAVLGALETATVDIGSRPHAAWQPAGPSFLDAEGEPA